jgi:hypothetical protein
MPTDGARQCIGYEANCIGDVQRASSFSAVLMPLWQGRDANDAALNSTEDMDNNRIAGDCSTLPWPRLRRQLRPQQLHSTPADTRADALAC